MKIFQKKLLLFFKNKTNAVCWMHGNKKKKSFIIFKEGKICKCKFSHVPINAKIYKYNRIQLTFSASFRREEANMMKKSIAVLYAG
jgi:hypothetical protein